MPDMIATLNDLIATCRDSETCFGKAAEVAYSDDLRARFTGIASERADFVDELAVHVRSLGGAPAETGHHDVIDDVQFSPRDDAALLAACEAGEEEAARRYAEALSRDLPVAIRAVVSRQRLAIEETVGELGSIERVRRAG